MFHLHSSLSYYLYPFFVDMRKSFYTLAGIVTNNMGKNIREGGVFIFVNRNRNIMKILHMEYAGMVIYHKKLDSGSFKLPGVEENTKNLVISWQDLMAIVQDVKVSPKHLKKKQQKATNC